MTRHLLIAAAVGAALLVLDASAQTATKPVDSTRSNAADKKLPQADADASREVNIQGDHLRYDDLRQVAVVTGNVQVVRGSVVLRSDRFEYRQSPEGFQSGVAFGSTDKRAWFRQRRPGTDQYVEGLAERIEYDGRGELVVLNQHAQMRRLEGSTIADELSGHQITYNSRTDVYEASSGSSNVDPGNPGGRVNVTIVPRNTTPAPKGGDRSPALKPSGSIEERSVK